MTDENVATMDLDDPIVVQRHHLTVHNLDQDVGQWDIRQFLQRFNFH